MIIKLIFLGYLDKIMEPIKEPKDVIEFLRFSWICKQYQFYIELYFGKKRMRNYPLIINACSLIP